MVVEETAVPTGWKEQLLLAEDSLHQPHGSDQHMNGIGQECGTVPFNHVAKGGQPERGRDEEQSDDPMKPDDHNRREPKRDGDHVQRPVSGVRMLVVVVMEEAQRSPPRCRRIIAAERSDQA